MGILIDKARGNVMNVKPGAMLADVYECSASRLNDGSMFMRSIFVLLCVFIHNTMLNFNPRPCAAFYSI